MAEDGGNRYPGARPFRDDDVDRAVFKGRGIEIETLLHTILSERLVVVHARSGVGKTSLLNAGLAGPLRHKGRFPLFVRVNRPDLGPLESVYRSIDEQGRQSSVEYVPGDRTSLWHFFKTTEFWQGDRLLTPVLVADQFEELFTLNSPERRDEVGRQLADLVRGRVPDDVTLEEGGLTDTPPVVGVVLSMRDDFLGQMEELAERMPGILRTRFQVRPLNRGQASEAILEPAGVEHERIGGQSFGYSDQLLKAILDLLCRQPHTGGEESAEPFQLQVICSKVEQVVAEIRRRDPGFKQVSLEDLGGEKGIRKTIADFYQQKISTVGRTRRLKKMCEIGLINEDGRRRSVAGEELIERFKVAPASLEALVDCRVLRRDPRLGGMYYELSHDTMVDPVLASRRKRRARGQTLKLVGTGVVVIAVSTVFLVSYIGKRMERNTAETQVEAGRSSFTAAIEVLDAVSQLQPPPPEELIDQIAANVADAQEQMDSADASLESGVFHSALNSGSAAESAAIQACELMRIRIVEPRTRAFLNDARRRIDHLERVGADRNDEARWRAVQERLEAFADQGSGNCEDARRRLALGATATDLATELSAIELEAEAHWPELADFSRHDAAAALDALPEPSGEPLQAAASEAAQAAFERGERFLEDQDYLGARQAFHDATFNATEAREVAEAFRAREGWRELLRMAWELGVGDLVSTSEAGGRADSGRRTYERRAWLLAMADFDRAAEIGEGALDRIMLEQTRAMDARSRAAAAREVAELLAGEGSWDRGNLRRGAELFQSATLAFDARRFQDAAWQYGRTVRLFARVGAQADRSHLDGALSALQEDRADLEPVCEQGTPGIESLCARVAGLREDSETVEPVTRAALESYAEANLLELRAADRLRAADLPPVIAGMSPENREIQVFRSEPVTLAVEVSTAQGANLSYLWSTPAGPLESQGPSVTFPADVSGAVTLVVAGPGGETNRTWDVVVTNRSPSLTVHPTASEQSISIGERLRFRAEANDPDGDPVEIVYHVDGRVVSREPLYEFTGERRGTFHLAVHAIDASGGTAEVQRSIRVRPGEAVATSSQRDLEPADYARRTLSRYRSAYQTRDLKKLASVWDMTSLQRKELGSIFASSRSIEISIVERDLRQSSDGVVEIDFDQQLSIADYRQSTQTRAPNSPGQFQSSSLTATIVSRGKGEWVISTLLPRREAARAARTSSAGKMVKLIIGQLLGVDVDRLRPETSLTGDLGADSLDAVEIVMEIEEVFGIYIPDEDAEKLRTVGDIIRYVEARVEGEAAER